VLAIFCGTSERYCKIRWKGIISKELAALWKWWRWRMAGDFSLDYVNDMSYHTI